MERDLRLRLSWTLLLAYVAVSTIPLVTPRFMIKRMLPLLWVLGPAANLIYGSTFLVPFVVGTFLVFAAAYGVLAAQTVWRQIGMIIVLVLSWSIFGLVAYAPGM
jgi:hypothetical protein